jgi:hypothetical protein
VAVSAAAKSGPKHRVSVAGEPKTKQSKAARDRPGQDVKMHRQEASNRAKKQKGKYSKDA